MKAPVGLSLARGCQPVGMSKAAEVTCVGVFLFGGRWCDSNRVQRPAQGAEVSGSLPGEQNAVRNAERKLFSLKIRHEDAFCAIKTKKNMPYSLGYMDFSRNNMKKSSKTMAFLFWIC